MVGRGVRNRFFLIALTRACRRAPSHVDRTNTSAGREFVSRRDIKVSRKAFSATPRDRRSRIDPERNGHKGREDGTIMRRHGEASCIRARTETVATCLRSNAVSRLAFAPRVVLPVATVETVVIGSAWGIERPGLAGHGGPALRTTSVCAASVSTAGLLCPAKCASNGSRRKPTWTIRPLRRSRPGSGRRPGTP